MEKIEYNIAIYIRLSKEDRKDLDESESITNQRRLILTYLKERDLTNYYEYIDDGYSGTTTDRPSFKRMINDIEHNKINMVITKDLSRLGRDYIETGRLLEKYFPENNIRYISILDNIDTATDNSNNDIAPFKSLFNDMYAKDISRKVKTSLIVKKRQGLFLGWKAPYGYIKDPTNKYRLIIDNKVEKIVKKIFEYAKEKKTSSQIANTLNNEGIQSPQKYLDSSSKSTWSSRTIEDILSNPTYIGHLTQGKRRKISYKSKKEIRTSKDEWIVTPNCHMAIIKENIFYEVEKRIKNKVKYSKVKYLLSKYLYCKECNHPITIVRSNDKKRLYTSCSYYRKHSKEKLCTPHSMNYLNLEKEIVDSKVDINKINKILMSKEKKLEIIYK